MFPNFYIYLKAGKLKNYGPYQIIRLSIAAVYILIIVLLGFDLSFCENTVDLDQLVSNKAFILVSTLVSTLFKSTCFHLVCCRLTDKIVEEFST